MKTFFVVTLLALMSVSAFAEHEATYCGQVITDKKAKNEFGEGFQAVIQVNYDVLSGDAWEDNYVTVKAYAGITGLSKKEVGLVAKAALKKKTICAKASWGGSMETSKKISKITLITDAVSKIDFEENFQFDEEEDVYGI